MDVQRLDKRSVQASIRQQLFNFQALYTQHRVPYMLQVYA